MPETDTKLTADDDRRIGMALFNAAWTLMEKESRTRDEEDAMVPCLHHARRALDLCQENGVGDFDLAFAYEALARGHALAGDAERARAYTAQAFAAAEDITEEDDRGLLGDLETIPGQSRFW
jgi:hypothetical protein